jgi:hypothetical protein
MEATRMKATQTTDERSGDIGALLADEHRRLEALFEALVAAFAADARDDICRLWTDLDRTLTAHMALEERLILPEFAKVSPEEAFALLAEHGELRRTLLELGVCVDLHSLRADLAGRFVGRLREHARREDNLLYRWAARHVDPVHAGKLLAHLRDAPGRGA